VRKRGKERRRGNQERGIRGGKGVRSEERVEEEGEEAGFHTGLFLGGGNVDVCNGHRHASVHQSYLLFQYLALGGLGIPKVHKFIKQLVDEDKVVPNTLLFQLPKILLKHLWRDR